MISVVFIGPVFSPTGFGTACRAYIDVLKTLPINLHVIALETKAAAGSIALKERTPYIPFLCRPLHDEHPAAKSELSYYDFSFTHKWVGRSTKIEKNLGLKSVGKRVWIGLWEADTYLKKWCRTLEKYYDEIASPCNFTSSVPAPIPYTAVLPYYLPSPSFRPVQSTGHKKVIFYCLATPVVRKNLIQAVRCFVAAFSGNSNVEYVIKLGRVAAHTLSNNLIDKISREVRRVPDAPRVVVLQNVVSESSIQALHQAGDIFFLPSHCEGFGIPQFTALRYGNPVVAPNYGGLNDFMNSSNSFDIPYRMECCKKAIKQWPFENDGTVVSYNHSYMKWAGMTDADVIKTLLQAYQEYKTKQSAPVQSYTRRQAAAAFEEYFTKSSSKFARKDTVCSLRLKNAGVLSFSAEVLS